MKYSYRMQGTCAQQVDFDLDENGKVGSISFYGGCNGNLKAISKLCEGLDAKQVINTLKGNTCGYKNTSCADQFAIALEKALANQ